MKRLLRLHWKLKGEHRVTWTWTQGWWCVCRCGRRWYRRGSSSAADLSRPKQHGQQEVQNEWKRELESEWIVRERLQRRWVEWRWMMWKWMKRKCFFWLVWAGPCRRRRPGRLVCVQRGDVHKGSPLNAGMDFRDRDD